MHLSAIKTGTNMRLKRFLLFGSVGFNATTTVTNPPIPEPPFLPRHPPVLSLL